MDSFFGIGLPELILILVIAGMVMGPERIARTARMLGNLTAKLQGVGRTFMRQLNAELDSVDQDGQLRSTVDELQQLRRQVAELRGEIMTLAGGTAADTKKVMRDIKQEAENAIMPPNLLAASKAATGAGATKPPATSDAPVHRPPSLLDDAPAAAPPVVRPPVLVDEVPPAANGHTIVLPRLLDVAEDPDPEL